MSFTAYSQFKPTKQIIWQHHWKDGSRLELTQDFKDFILLEYGADGNLIFYKTDKGSSSEERYSKKHWKLNAVIQDIKQEYDMGD